MRKPKAANMAIDGKRIKTWTDLFGSYRHAVTKTTIESWLDQFDDEDRDLAARVLDAVEYYGSERIAACFRDGLKSLHGWNANPGKRAGRWRFVAFSGSTGESGDAMLAQFRLANNLGGKPNDNLFIHRSELVSERLTSEDTVVMVDDLTATGNQVCEVWAAHFAELVAGVGRVYLMVIVAGSGARKQIRDNTDLELIATRNLEGRDSFFSAHCGHFTAAEKERLLRYAKIADAERPRGYGECGYLLVFQHRCPNNSVPILHESHSKWEGLFLRHD